MKVSYGENTHNPKKRRGYGANREKREADKLATLGDWEQVDSNAYTFFPADRFKTEIVTLDGGRYGLKLIETEEEDD